MSDFSYQISRIKEKLIAAKKADPHYRVFNAASHQYEINSPLTELEIVEFEKLYGITLPSCYRTFIKTVGNKGKSWLNSAAGPFYGILPLGRYVNYIFESAEKYLKNECVIYPTMTDESWDSLTKAWQDDTLEEDEYFDEVGKIYGGILPIGSQGCTYLHALIVTGAYKGKVVNINFDGCKPKFTFENNFLDWYERWLDEIINGELLKGGPCWFGYERSKEEGKLITYFIESEDSNERIEILSELLNKDRLKQETLIQLKQFYFDFPEFKLTILEIFCKFDFEYGKPFIIELMPNDYIRAVRLTYEYAFDNCNALNTALISNKSKIGDAQSLKMFIEILQDAELDYGTIIAEFASHEEEDIKIIAFRFLGKLKDKVDYLDLFISGLQNSKTNRLKLVILECIDGVIDESLFEEYLRIYELHSEKKDMVYHMVKGRLIKNNVIKEEVRIYDEEKLVIKPWYRFWK